jgi:hypothetical protein
MGWSPPTLTLTLCDVPPLAKNVQFKLGSLWGAVTEVMMHNISHTRIKHIKHSES